MPPRVRNFGFTIGVVCHRPLFCRRRPLRTQRHGPSEKISVAVVRITDALYVTTVAPKVSVSCCVRVPIAVPSSHLLFRRRRTKRFVDPLIRAIKTAAYRLVRRRRNTRRGIRRTVNVDGTAIGARAQHETETFGATVVTYEASTMQ